jgi:hypothetical protein
MDISFLRMPLHLVRPNDVDLADDPFRLGPDEIDRQQTVGQVRAHDLHAIDKEEGALELTGAPG